MKQTLFLPLLLGVVLLGSVAPSSRAAQTNNEAQLIATLQSPGSTARQKSDACAELKRTGTKRSVKALAALLTDEQLSHSARYVLETLPDPAAGKALRQALGKTSGILRVGVINSLGMRHETDAVRDLGKLLSSPDQAVAVASAGALGEIGGRSAIKLLQASFAKSSGSVHQAETDAFFMCARGLMTTGDDAAAFKLFEALYKNEKAEVIRRAAFSGMILAAGKQSVAMAANAIVNGDPVSQAAALHVASQLKGPEATTTLADLAIGAKVPFQLALVACLMQRGDPAAAASLTRLADNEDASVRLAATAALGSLGDDSSVKPLVEKAVSSKGEERSAARQSLLELNRGPVTQRILGLMGSASPKMKSELILALGGRGDRSAIPALLSLARQGNDDERAACLQALGLLSDASQIPAFVEMVVDASSDDFRSQVADALGAIYLRMATTREQDVEPLVKAVTSGSIETRVALLPVCSQLSEPAVRAALRAAVADGDARIKDAAIHALCDTHDLELLPDLLDLAAGKGGDAVRHLAIRGCIHLTCQEEDVRYPGEKKIPMFSQLLADSPDAGDKRLILSGLGAVADQRTLEVAVGLLGDADVQAEAEQAVIAIARDIRGKHPAKARAALKKVVDQSKSADNRQSAKDLLDKIK